MRNTFARIAGLALIGICATSGAYPLDGYEDTGIRRVEGARLANEGLVEIIPRRGVRVVPLSPAASTSPSARHSASSFSGVIEAESSAQCASCSA